MIKKGLYNPIFEHENCGAGFICSLNGIKSNDIINKALNILTRLEHRGAVSSDGRTGDGEKIQEWCFENNVIFIEDSAHALGSSYKSSKCGSIGDLSVISFTPHKIITMGQGGMVFTNDQNFYEYLISIKTFNLSLIHI